jgi:hypothetical protein
MLVQYFIFTFLGVFVALGAAFAGAAVGLLRKIAACRRWPTVTGKVMRTRLDSMVEDDDSDAGRSHRSPRETEYFGATIRYAFSVAGREYQSTRRYIGRPVLSGSPRAAAKVLAKYPPDAAVTVHYNPANPAEAVLEPGNLANVNMALIAAIGFGGGGLLAMACVWSVF